MKINLNLYSMLIQSKKIPLNVRMHIMSFKIFFSLNFKLALILLIFYMIMLWILKINFDIFMCIAFIISAIITLHFLDNKKFKEWATPQEAKDLIEKNYDDQEIKK